MEADMDLKNAFKELHEKLKFASQKIKLIDMQIDNLRRTKQHNALTKQEIVDLPKDVNTYEAVGRAFILTPREEVFKNLDKVHTETEQKITGLENNKTYLEKNLKESENNIREMVKRKKEASSDKDQPGSSKA